MLQDNLPLVIGIVVALVSVGAVALNYIIHPAENPLNIPYKKPDEEVTSHSQAEELRDQLFRHTGNILGLVKNYWLLQDEQEEHRRNRTRFLAKRTGEQERKGLPVDPTKLQGEADRKLGEVDEWELTTAIIVSAWTRRLAYFVLEGCLVVGLYMITAPVTPFFGGFTSSDSNPFRDLYSLFQYRQVLAGLVLISCIPLVALLIADYSGLVKIPAVLKMTPSIGEIRRNIYFMLAILVGIADLMAIAALTIAGIEIDAVHQFSGLDALLAIIGMMIAASLGMLLGLNAMLKGGFGVLRAMLGVLVAFPVFLAGGAVVLGILMLHRLNAISRLLHIKLPSTDADRSPPSRPPFPNTPNNVSDSPGEDATV